MINSEKNIYIQETEITPNHYAMFVLCATMAVTLTCWLLNELEIFHVGLWVMRIGAGTTTLAMAIPLVMVSVNKNAAADPRTKYFMIIAGAFFTITVTTLMTFHTTLMLLFPTFMAMLYRSKKLGNIAVCVSCLCTALSPIFGYLLGVWDIPLMQELIAIGTNGTVIVEGATDALTWLSVGKIFLFLCLPKLMMVGACSLLMFYVIRLGEDHVNNQILLAHISRHDSLTGLYNQNYYKEILTKEFTGTVGVVFFDVNDLKALNDSRGHEYGDLLLRRSAQSIADVCDSDSVSGFRIGGDEFLLIMEGACEADVERKLVQWSEALTAINAENAVKCDGIVCSMATGYVVGDFSRLAELVSLADVKMYENKAQMKQQE